MKKRRRRDEGSIYKRKDGRWVAVYTVEGKKRYIYAKTRKEAARRLNQAIADRDAGLVYDSENWTVANYLERWLASVKPTVKHSTYRRYEEASRLHIAPALGRYKLSRLSPTQLQNLYLLKLQSLSPRSVQIIHRTINKALKQAVRWSLIPRNVAELVDAPRIPHAEIKPLTREQVKTLLSAARGDRLEALYVLAITMGMRQGELLGLQCGDVNGCVHKLL
ncbi:MAG: site-specific integrase [Chloroflexota bacterium]|jgi:integrase|nr:site-specific integrase [Chloroflexota bacterium]